MLCTPLQLPPGCTPVLCPTCRGGSETSAGRGGPLFLLQPCLQPPHTCPEAQAGLCEGRLLTPANRSGGTSASDPRLLPPRVGGWGAEAPSLTTGERSCGPAGHLASGGTSPRTTPLVSVSRANRSLSPGAAGILDIPAKLSGARWDTWENKQLQKLATSALKCAGKTRTPRGCVR